MEQKHSTGILLLAAGASTRMGSPKQLLQMGTENLLQRCIRIATQTNFQPLVVVLGANHEHIQPTLTHLPVQPVYNAEWASGMGSSIACGLQHLLQLEPVIEQVLILVGDQPLLDAERLAQMARISAPLVVSRYADTLGVPALFKRTLFPALLKLRGAPGAKSLIQQYAHQASIVDFPEGALDIDTPSEWENFMTKINPPIG